MLINHRRQKDCSCERTRLRRGEVILSAKKREKKLESKGHESAQDAQAEFSLGRRDCN